MIARRRARARVATAPSSAAIALGIVLVNFLARPRSSVGWAAKISPAAVGGVALGGYVVRLALILVALVLLRHVSWIVLPGARLHARRRAPRVAVWEMRYVSCRSPRPGSRPRSA